MILQTLKQKAINGLHFTYVNEDEFHYTYLATFKWRFYHFRTRTKAPLIIDCGAHIGVSLLYFKQKYPESHVIGFEANPDTFKLLEENVRQNQLTGVELVQAAVNDRKGTTSFYVGKEDCGELTQWGDSGVQNKWNTVDAYKTITVPAVRLSSYIEESVDFLKINIEGMEGIVLKDIESKLYLVKELRIEYHGSSTNPTNTLEDMLSILSQQGFRYVLEQNRRVVGLMQVRRNDPYFLNIYTYTQWFPWWYHRYIWYMPSRVRFVPSTVHNRLRQIARQLGVKRK